MESGRRRVVLQFAVACLLAMDLIQDSLGTASTATPTQMGTTAVQTTPPLASTLAANPIPTPSPTLVQAPLPISSMIGLSSNSLSSAPSTVEPTPSATVSSLGLFSTLRSTVEPTPTATVSSLGLFSTLRSTVELTPSATVSSLDLFSTLRSTVEPTLTDAVLSLHLLSPTQSSPAQSNHATPLAMSPMRDTVSTIWLYVAVPLGVGLLCGVLFLVLCFTCLCYRRSKREEGTKTEGESGGSASYMMKNMSSDDALRLEYEGQKLDFPSEIADSAGLSSQKDLRRNSLPRSYPDTETINSNTVSSGQIRPTRSLSVLYPGQEMAATNNMLYPSRFRRDRKANMIYDVPRAVQTQTQLQPKPDGKLPRYVRMHVPQRTASTSAIYQYSIGASTESHYQTPRSIREGVYDVPRSAVLRLSSSYSTQALYQELDGPSSMPVPSYYDVPRQHVFPPHPSSNTPWYADSDERTKQASHYDTPKQPILTIPRAEENWWSESNEQDQTRRREPRQKGHLSSSYKPKPSRNAFSTYDVPRNVRANTVPSLYDIPRQVLGAQGSDGRVWPSLAPGPQAKVEKPVRSIYDVPRHALHTTNTDAGQDSDTSDEHVYDEPPLEFMEESRTKRPSKRRSKRVPKATSSVSKNSSVTEKRGLDGGALNSGTGKSHINETQEQNSDSGEHEYCELPSPNLQQNHSHKQKETDTTRHHAVELIPKQKSREQGEQASKQLSTASTQNTRPARSFSKLGHPPPVKKKPRVKLGESKK